MMSFPSKYQLSGWILIIHHVFHEITSLNFITSVRHSWSWAARCWSGCPCRQRTSCHQCSWWLHGWADECLCTSPMTQFCVQPCQTLSSHENICRQKNHLNMNLNVRVWPKLNFKFKQQSDVVNWAYLMMKWIVVVWVHATLLMKSCTLLTLKYSKDLYNNLSQYLLETVDKGLFLFPRFWILHIILMSSPWGKNSTTWLHDNQKGLMSKGRFKNFIFGSLSISLNWLFDVFF